MGCAPVGQLFYFYLPVEASRFPADNDWMLEVYVELDGGFQRATGAVEPSASSFAPVEESTSMLSLVAWKCEKAAEKPSAWFSAWSRSLEYTDSASKQLQTAQCGSLFSSLELGEHLVELGSESKVREFARSAKLRIESELLGTSLETS